MRPIFIGRSGNRADQLQPLVEGGFMANPKVLASIVSELRVERTNLVNRLNILMLLFQFLAS